MALRRAGRAAILMPALFALGEKVIQNADMSYFIAFGSFAMLLFVDFGGTRLDRLRSQTLLGLACALLICLGTLASRSTVIGTAAMFVVALVVLFSSVVSSVMASATTPLLLAFILPVTIPGTVSQIPERVAGWGIAAAVSLFAITLMWPAPANFPVEGRLVDACRALAARIRAEVAWVRGGGAETEAAYVQRRTAADASVRALEQLFLATPYRPTGLSTQDRAEIRLVDELRWLAGVVLRSAATTRPPTPDESVCHVKNAAADVLDAAAAALSKARSRLGAEHLGLQEARERLRAALNELEEQTTALPVSGGASALPVNGRLATVISSLDPGFRAQELAYITDQIGGNARFAAAAAKRTWMRRLVGRQPAGFTGPLSSALERARAHATPNSSWLHNSLRGASGLALAVLVAELTSVQHGFWVVFGTIAVLRSNALSTGQNAVRGLIGTAAGFIVGGAIVALIGTNTDVLWLILPVAVLLAGLAPAAISFAAGQAAFTATLLILFNLLLPVGWKLGLVRVEDVAIGGLVSLAVGLLFWPSGAASDLGRALGRAYVESVGYLSEAVAYGVACCDAARVPEAQKLRAQADEAAASARRLDDTFRGYLVERGAKHAPLSEVTTLVTGVAGLRLAADAVIDLWDGDGHSRTDDGNRAAASHELLEAAGHLAAWYGLFAASLTRAATVPDPLVEDGATGGRLVAAVATDLLDGDGHATATGVRIIWTGDHLDAVRRLQSTLVGPARTAVSGMAISG